MTKLSCIILGAGKGTRMKSDRPKVMMPLAGCPMIRHLIATCEKLDAQKIVTVIADGMDDVAAACSPHATAIQEKQLGTGDAARAGLAGLGKTDSEFILILLGDAPLVTVQSLRKLIDAAKVTGLSVAAMRPADPAGYGRLATDENGLVTRIIEDADCTPVEKNIGLVNGGNFCVRADRVGDWLAKIKNNNAQNEFYLTDMIAIAGAEGVSCAAVEIPEDEMRGLNTRAHVAQAEAVVQRALRAAALDAGVGMVAPDTVYFSMDTQIGPDTVIEPDVFFGPAVTIGAGVRIHAFSHLEGVTVEDGAQVGPFARVRPKSHIGAGATVGNFVEVNRSKIGAGAKSKHVSYLGDADIGAKANIGAGTVIANYDGFEKQPTHIGERVFIGSNSTIVAPITIAEGSYVGAGSTITSDVPEDSLAIARSRTVIRDGWAAIFQARKQDNKKAG